MGEKIEKTLNKISKKRVAELIDDCYYGPEMEAGILFHVRRGDFFKPQPKHLKLSYGRTYHLADEGLKQHYNDEKVH